jgi:cystathionine gamma-lyase
MISIVLKDADLQKTFHIASSFKLFKLAELLGSLEFLINYSASMIHGSISKSERDKFGVVNNFLHLSIGGVENLEDLLKG